MTIVKKIKGKNVKVAEKSIIDHSQLSGTQGYNCHPISAIRKLPEKLTSLKNADTRIETKLDEEIEKTDLIEDNAKQISLKEDPEHQGKLLFTDYEGTEFSLQGGFLADNDTTQIIDDKIALKKVYHDETLSGNGVSGNELSVVAIKGEHASYTADSLEEVFGNIDDELEAINGVNEQQDEQIDDLYKITEAIKGVGGYLIPHDFDSTTPDQPIDDIKEDSEGHYDPSSSTLSLLTQYALQQISSINDPREIWNGTRITNLENNHTWVLNNNYPEDFSWTDLGQASISIANTDTLGVVKGSNDNLKINTDVNGEMSVNGLSDYLNDTIDKIGGTKTTGETVEGSINETISEISSIWERGTGNNSVQQKGTNCSAQGDYSSSQGYATMAKANYSHTEGFTTKTSSDNEHDARYSHAEGYLTEAAGLASHAEGDTTYTQNIAEHAQGRGNKSHKDSDSFGSAGNTIHSIGIGSNNQDITTFKNAVEVMQNGDQYVIGVGGYNGKNIENAETLQNVIAEKSSVQISESGTSAQKAKYIIVDGVEYKVESDPIQPEPASETNLGVIRLWADAEGRARLSTTDFLPMLSTPILSLEGDILKIENVSDAESYDIYINGEYATTINREEL